MKKITISDAQKNTSPNPFSLVCANTPLGTTNLTAVSWWTYLANQPPMIGFAINKKSYTGELILKGGHAVLSIPGKSMAEAAYKCGCVTGRDTNKAEKFGIELIGKYNKFPLHSKIAFVCTLEKTCPVGDHILYICNINDIYFNDNEKQLYAWEGYSKLGTLSQNNN